MENEEKRKCRGCRVDRFTIIVVNTDVYEKMEIKGYKKVGKSKLC